MDMDISTAYDRRQIRTVLSHSRYLHESPPAHCAEVGCQHAATGFDRYGHAACSTHAYPTPAPRPWPYLGRLAQVDDAIPPRRMMCVHCGATRSARALAWDAAKHAACGGVWVWEDEARQTATRLFAASAVGAHALGGYLAEVTSIRARAGRAAYAMHRARERYAFQAHADGGHVAARSMSVREFRRDLMCREIRRLLRKPSSLHRAAGTRPLI